MAAPAAGRGGCGRGRGRGGGRTPTARGRGGGNNPPRPAHPPPPRVAPILAALVDRDARRAKARVVQALAFFAANGWVVGGGGKGGDGALVYPEGVLLARGAGREPVALPVVADEEREVVEEEEEKEEEEEEEEDDDVEEDEEKEEEEGAAPEAPRHRIAFFVS